MPPKPSREITVSGLVDYQEKEVTLETRWKVEDWETELIDIKLDGKELADEQDLARLIGHDDARNSLTQLMRRAQDDFNAGG